MGVNHEVTRPSTTSSQRKLHDQLPAPTMCCSEGYSVEGLMTTVWIHGDAEGRDGQIEKDWKGGRSAINIIPSSTGARKRSAWRFPRSKAATGMFRVPRRRCRSSIDVRSEGRRATKKSARDEVRARLTKGILAYSMTKSCQRFIHDAHSASSTPAAVSS